MWTHRTPYRESELTVESIRGHGRTAFYRALSVGRVVAFVGSGATVAYGRPSWAELVREAVEKVETEYLKRLPPRPRAQALYIQMRRIYALPASPDDGALLAHQQPPSEDQPIVLEVLDHLARELDIRKDVLGGIADNFKKPGAGDADPIRQLDQGLGIRRFLTINCDVELERHFSQRFDLGGVTGDMATQLKKLIGAEASGPADGAAAEGASDQERQSLGRIEVTEGLHRYLLSASVADPHIGDLISFAAHSARYDAQILHIHGRLDAPTEFVLTEADYQRTYIKSSSRRRIFDEAMHMLFSGNDVLFVGVGMDESDLLRPLRQFVAQERSPDFDARRIFALLPETVKGSMEEDRKRDELRTLRLKLANGVHTLHYGGRDFRALLEFLNAARDKAERPDDTDEKNDLETLWKAVESEEKDLREKLSVRRTEAFSSLVTREDKEELVELREAPYTHLDDENRAEQRKRIAKLKDQVISRALERKLKTLARKRDDWFDDWRQIPRERRARHRDFSNSDARPVWVRHRADYRPFDAAHAEPIVRRIKQAVAKQSLPPVRQAPNRRRVARIAAPRGSGKGAITYLLAQPRDAHARDASAPPALHWFDGLFDDNPGAQPDYAGAFFAHLSFSVEFSSIIGALSLFVYKVATQRIYQNYSAASENLKSDVKDLERYFQGNQPPPEEAPAKILLLRRSLHLLRKTNLREGMRARSEQSNRIFVCLSGLDRLCTSEGVARNPMHRAFFRLLSGVGLRFQDESSDAFPMDVLLISGAPNVPIRYLSRPAPKAELDPAYARDYVTPRGASEPLERWRPIQGLAFEERHWRAREYEAARELGLERREPNLWRALRRSVAMSSWFFGQWRLADKDPDCEAANLELIRTVARRIGTAHGAEATRRGLEGVLAYAGRARHGAGGGEGWALQDVLLRHLTLFPVPVEPRVLYSCPEIKKRLTSQEEETFLKRRENDLSAGGHVNDHDEEASERQSRRRLVFRAMRRAWRFGRLQRALDDLCERGLAIRIHPKLAPATGPGSDDLKWTFDAVQARYTVHPQMQETLASDMGLMAPDVGDRGRFQMSLYCDQPRDLPTPSKQHYRLIRAIVDNLIRQGRHTLWCFYQLGRRTGEFDRDDDMHRQNARMAARGLWRRLKLNDLDEAAQHQELDDWWDEFGKIPDPNKPVYASDLGRVGQPNGQYGPVHAVSQRTRAAYGLLRSGFSLATMTRLASYDDDRDVDQPLERVRNWLRSIINLSVGLDECAEDLRAMRKAGELDLSALNIGPEAAAGHEDILKDLNAHLKGRESDAFHRPFYQEEIAWLLNEQALISLLQGRLYDAIPLFERAREALKSASEDNHYNASLFSAERRIRLNLAIAQIGRGKLSDAQDALASLIQETHDAKRTPSMLQHYAEGYLGVIDHISNDFENAERRYLNVLQFAEAEPRPRVVAIFARHYADLLTGRDHRDAADGQIRRAIRAAHQAEQRDILHLCKLTQAKLFLRGGEHQKALALVQNALGYADQLGVPAIEGEALSVHATIMTHQGEKILAGRTLASAIAIFSRNGMRLRKLTCLTAYARLLIDRGEPDLANEILNAAKWEAELRGHVTLGGTIERLHSDDAPLNP